MSTATERRVWIEQIRAVPEQIAQLTANLTPEQLSTPFLAGEWSVAQNVHHLVDSHVNSYIRCKLIITEENPPLKPYDQDIWAALPDASAADISMSLMILRGLHARWATFWENLDDDAWSRLGNHMVNGPVTLERQLSLYAEHGLGHIDQIQRTLAAQP